MFLPDGASVAYGAVDGWIRLRDWKTGTVIAAQKPALREGPRSVAISSDGRTIAASGDSRIGLWAPEAQSSATIEGYTGRAYSAAFSPDGSIIAVGRSDGAVGWNVATRERVIYETYDNHVSSVAFSPDGRLLASATSREIQLLGVETGVGTTLSGHTNHINSLAFSPDGTTLASGANGGMVMLWDLATGQDIATLMTGAGWVRTVAFSRDGMTISAGLPDGRWELWDVVTGSHAGILDVPPDWVSTVFSPNTESFRGTAFSPDGRTSASWTHGRWRERHPFRVNVWDALSGKGVATLEGHGATVNSVAFSPDGSILASVSQDGTALLWDMQLVLPHPRALAKLSGDDQLGEPDAVLGEPLVVVVTDQNGDPLQGARVTFRRATGTGALSAAADTTDAQGRASTTMVLGPEPGTYTVLAAVADLEPVTFTATARPTPDFDGDGEVGFADFHLFYQAFGGSDPRFDLDNSGSVDFADFFLFAEHFGQPARAKLVAMAREILGPPDGPLLRQNAPNPFNSGTVISWFQLLPGPAHLEVFALTGQRVAVLHEGLQKAGLHRRRWDGRDDRGHALASGIYAYRLVTAKGVQSRKLTLLR